jgi:hypothetical protein
MRVPYEPWSSEELQGVIDAAMGDAKIGHATATEKYPPQTGCDAFKEDFLKVRLPGYIRVVCK